MAGHPGLPAYGAFPGAGPQRSPYYAPPYASHPSQPYHQYPPYPYHQQYGPQPSHYVGANNGPPIDPPYGPPPPGPIPSGPPIHPNDGDETKRKNIALVSSATLPQQLLLSDKKVEGPHEEPEKKDSAE